MKTVQFQDDMVKKSQDMKDHCYWCDVLLNHYCRTWMDRQVYWTVRERARQHGDVLVVAIDSYDKAKVTLPRYPFGRTPKKPIYEQIRRPLDALVMFFYISAFYYYVQYLDNHD